MTELREQNELKVLMELQRLARLLLEPVKGYDAIGGFHVKEQRLIRRFLDGEEEWLFRQRDSMLQIYKTKDTPKTLLVEFNGFGDLSWKGHDYDFVDAIGVLTSLQKILILDVLADV